MKAAALLCAAIMSASSTGAAKLAPDRVKLACKHAGDVVAEAKKRKVSPYVIAALVHNESRWNATKKGTSGECGVGQALPRFTKFSCRQLQHIPNAIAVVARKLSPRERSWGGRAISRCAWERTASRKSTCKSSVRALAGYNAGTDGMYAKKTNRGIRGMNYANRILALARLLKARAARAGRKRK